ncbi:epithelial membrane protein 1-like [Physella acuta]|uniref:epithelial membrane protein 1-like n=1 Tax=Physella acuta TaxID=109671 RepID=UPI0027DB1EFB|nr:epithelial membrane protein 1-like [Physella acuta]XP_059139321.1 epithelial membrane protein 1-like [Physella acuta]
MGVREGFAKSNIATKIAFFIVLLAVFANWIAFCTTSWYRNAGTYVGLWRVCTSSIACSVLDGSPNDKLDAIQAFAVFGFMFLNVGFILILLYMFVGKFKGNAEAGIGSAICLIMSAATWLISVAIFGAEYDDNGSDKLGYSYALAVCALILALIGGIIMIIGGRGNSSVSSK